MQNDINQDGRVVVILGMDRTGTSLCTNILYALGMRLGPRLVPGDRFNENGYFEDPEILKVHERILEALDRSWETLEAVYPFPSGWWQSPAMDPFRDALVDIVRKRCAEGPGAWGFKDPRTVVLWPLWNEVFRICGVRPVFVLCVRHPAAVALSLATRNRFSLLFSELLWFEKTLAGCRAIQGEPHCIISYEEWFNDPLLQTRMLCKISGLPLEGPSEALMARVSSIVNSGLRHQDGDAIQSTAARNLYSHLVQSRELPDRDVLRQFEFACEAARDYVLELENLSGRRFLRESLVRAIKEDLARFVERCSVAEQRLRESDEDLAQWRERCSVAEQALVERDARLREMEDDRTRWMERCSTAEHALAERDARLRESEAAIQEEGQQWKEQLSQTTNLLKERELEIAAIRASATWRWSRNALNSWPARRLLGPVIRAVAGPRG